MAQLGSAPGLGPGGRRFESYCSDHIFKDDINNPLKCGFFMPKICEIKYEKIQNPLHQEEGFVLKVD